MCTIFTLQQSHRTAIEDIQYPKRTGGQKFALENQGDVNNVNGIQVKNYQDRTIHLTKPQLIDSILNHLHLQENSNLRDTPALSTRILHKDTEGENINLEFNYQSVICKLNFLE